MEAVREQEVKPKAEKKKSFINRMRKSTKQQEVTNVKEATKVKESRTPASSTSANSKSITREGVPVISSVAEHKFKPSDVRQNKQQSVKNGQKFERKSVILEQAPAARDAAFNGPPRYDWIDIETAAAIKVQSVFRRNKVMDEMAEDGMETTAMRNRRRRRKARKRSTRNKSRAATTSEDTPSLFQCCGAGLMFGDAAEEDENAQRAFEKEQWLEKQEHTAEEEAKLRAYKPRAKTNHSLRESIEIVE